MRQKQKNSKLEKYFSIKEGQPVKKLDKVYMQLQYRTFLAVGSTDQSSVDQRQPGQPPSLINLLCPHEEAITGQKLLHTNLSCAVFKQ